jgi:hypothetical protein
MGKKAIGKWSLELSWALLRGMCLKKMRLITLQDIAL